MINLGGGKKITIPPRQWHESRLIRLEIVPKPCTLASLAGAAFSLNFHRRRNPRRFILHRGSFTRGKRPVIINPFSTLLRTRRTIAQAETIYLLEIVRVGGRKFPHCFFSRNQSGSPSTRFLKKKKVTASHPVYRLSRNAQGREGTSISRLDRELSFHVSKSRPVSRHGHASFDRSAFETTRFHRSPENFRPEIIFDRSRRMDGPFETMKNESFLSEVVDVMLSK